MLQLYFLKRALVARPPAQSGAQTSVKSSNAGFHQFSISFEIAYRIPESGNPKIEVHHSSVVLL